MEHFRVVQLVFLVLSSGLCQNTERVYLVTPNERFAINITLNFAPMSFTYPSNAPFGVDCSSKVDFCLENYTDDTISIHGAVAPGDDVLVFLKGNEIIRKVPLVSSAAPDGIVLKDGKINEDRFIIFSDFGNLKSGKKTTTGVTTTTMFRNSRECSASTTAPCFKYLPSNITFAGTLKVPMANITFRESSLNSLQSFTVVLKPSGSSGLQMSLVTLVVVSIAGLLR